MKTCIYDFIKPDQRHQFSDVLTKLMKKSLQQAIPLSKLQSLSTEEHNEKITSIFYNILFTEPSEHFVKDKQFNIQLAKLNQTYVLDPNFRDAYHVFIKKAIALRTMLEIRKAQMQYPLKTLNLSTAIEDFEALRNHKPTGKSTDIAKSQAGMSSSDYFLHRERHKVGRESRASILDQWEVDSTLVSNIYSLLGSLHKAFVINDAQFRGFIDRTFGIYQFRPSTIPDVIAILKEEEKKKGNEYTIQSVYDPCGGWGDRLVGLLADPTIKDVVYNDVNDGLQEGYSGIAAAFKLKKTVHFIFKPAEKLTLDEICPNGMHDLVFSGLPFFTKERYLGVNQSTKLYPTVDSWNNDFLYKLVRQTACALKPGGYMVLNLADFKKENKSIAICGPLLHHVAESIPCLNLTELDLYYRTSTNTLQRGSDFISPLLVFQRNKHPLDMIPRLLVPAASSASAQAKENPDLVARVLQATRGEAAIHASKAAKSPAAGSSKEAVATPISPYASVSSSAASSAAAMPSPVFSGQSQFFNYGQYISQVNIEPRQWGDILPPFTLRSNALPQLAHAFPLLSTPTSMQNSLLFEPSPSSIGLASPWSGLSIQQNYQPMLSSIGYPQILIQRSLPSAGVYKPIPRHTPSLSLAQSDAAATHTFVQGSQRVYKPVANTAMSLFTHTESSAFKLNNSAAASETPRHKRCIIEPEEARKAAKTLNSLAIHGLFSSKSGDQNTTTNVFVKAA